MQAGAVGLGNSPSIKTTPCERHNGTIRSRSAACPYRWTGITARDWRQARWWLFEHVAQSVRGPWCNESGRYRSAAESHRSSRSLRSARYGGVRKRLPRCSRGRCPGHGGRGRWRGCRCRSRSRKKRRSRQRIALRRREVRCPGMYPAGRQGPGDGSRRFQLSAHGIRRLGFACGIIDNPPVGFCTIPGCARCHPPAMFAAPNPMPRERRCHPHGSYQCLYALGLAGIRERYRRQCRLTGGLRCRPVLAQRCRGGPTDVVDMAVAG